MRWCSRSPRDSRVRTRLGVNLRGGYAVALTDNECRPARSDVVPSCPGGEGFWVGSWQRG